jgi:hypothetical protein
MDMSFISAILEKAWDFIPPDINNKIDIRMSDGERATFFGEYALEAMKELNNVPGITPASSRDLKDSSNIGKLKDGTIVSRYVNPAGCEHIFLSNEHGQCIFGGWVGWIHNEGLRNKAFEICEKYS